MGIEVTRLEGDERERWNGYVERTPVAMPFHRRGALEAIAERADATLHLLCGRKGQEPVGLLPIFETTKGPLRFAYSPPTELELPYLGPVLLGTDRLKQRKADRWNRRFVDECVSWLDAHVDPDFVDIRALDRYPDVRPFLWNDFEVDPAYTYVLDLTPGPDELFEQFSSGARRNVRNAEDRTYTVEQGGEETIRRTVQNLRRRVESHGEDYGLDPEFAVQLFERLPEGDVRPYECRVDGEYAGGIVTVERGDTIYRWQGGAKPAVEFPVNDVLDWHIIQCGAERGVSRYDFVGAMIPQLCEYKAKFDPRPRPINQIRRRSGRMSVVSTVYQHLPTSVTAGISL